MSATDTWMPLDIGAYMADTMRLTTLQHGAYLLLLMDYWKSGPLPDDDDQLSAICKMDSKTWKINRSVIRKFFTPNGDGLLHQKRADVERGKTAKIASERSAAGRAGAAARWKQNYDKPPDTPPDKPHGKPIANACDCHQDPCVCHPFAIGFANTPVPLPLQKKEDFNSSSFRQEECAREGDRPTDILARRAAAKAELLDAGPAGMVVAALAEKLRHRPQQPYAEVRTKNEQLDELEPAKKIRPSYLTPEQLSGLNPARRRA